MSPLPNADGRWQQAAAALAAMAGGPATAQKDLSLSQAARAWLAGAEGTLDAGLNEPLRPYQQSLWVYRCVSEIQTSAAGVPLRLMAAGPQATVRAKSHAADIRRSDRRTLRPLRGCTAVCTGKAAEGEPIESGEAYELLAAPNGYQIWPQLMAATVGYLKLRGKVAWILTDLRGSRPGEIHVVDGSYVTPVWARGESGLPDLLGYKYKPPKSGGEIPLAVDEVKFFALWDDSDDPLGGMSPLKPGRLSVAADYNASLFNASALVNAFDPGLAIVFEGNLTDVQREQFLLNLKQRNRGPARAKREMILEGKADVKTLVSNFTEMQFQEGKKTTRLEICCLMGVPPVVAGWVDAAGDSSAYTANALRQFWQQTLFPLLDFVAPAIQEIVSRFDGRTVAYFDVEDQPVVQEMRLARVDSARKFFDMGYAPNDINDKLDLGMPQTPWGDTGYLPLNLVPADQVADGTGGLPPLAEGPADGEDPSDQGGGQRSKAGGVDIAPVDKDAIERVWKLFARSWEPLAKRMASMLRNHYGAQGRLVVAALKEALGGQAPKAQSPKPKADGIVARVLFDVFGNASSKEQFGQKVRAFVADANELGLRQALAEAGFEGEQLQSALKDLMRNPGVTAALQTETLQISATIDARTRDVLQRTLDEGMEAGEDIRALADRVQDTLGTSRARAMSVARNRVGQVLSRARADGRAKWATHEIWIHSRGAGERRPPHVAAERTYRAEPKPVGLPFVINGYSLRYPRDPSGPPGEIINCQCMVRGVRLRNTASADETRSAVAAAAVRDVVTYEQMVAQRQPAEP